ncbi:methionine synthase reductase-like isoform X1 [Schistocerca piceifrons]|uniref:methionine synthase reductase-like isoform X1 n=2 Tax=Schistocerca piceifrons TaxID=274613 RepID=UPI001F5F8714|nr:methionine synthase reductase-like isoform X1 [Schistocerca piceifrons]
MTDINILRTVNDTIINVKLQLPKEPPDYLGIEFLENEMELMNQKIQNACEMPLAASPIYMSRVIDARVLSTGEDVKQIIEMSLDIKEENMSWHPGDTIGVIPQNPVEEVEELLELLGVRDKANIPAKIFVRTDSLEKNFVVPPYLPSVSTLKHIFCTCLDIRSLPKKVLLRVLAGHASLPEEHLRLEQLCSRQGTRDYDACIVGTGATLLTLLRAFPSCRPPVTRVLQLLPRLTPRPYSLACSEAPPRVVFSVIPHGLCTNWLRSRLEIFCDLSKRLSAVELKDSVERDVRIPVYFRKASNFRMPHCHEKPLILIGPGTGIAPFIGFLQQRETEQLKFQNKKLGTIWLFFGCRYSSRDFIYRSVLQQFVEKQILSRLFVSFSRESDETSPKYVQDNVRLYGKDFVTKLIDEGGSVFICGDAKNMAKDVQEAISYVIQKEKGISEEAAQNCIKQLKNSARYVQDVWR